MAAKPKAKGTHDAWLRYCKRKGLDPNPRRLRKGSKLFSKLFEVCPECGQPALPVEAQLWGNGTIRAMYRCDGCLEEWSYYFSKQDFK